MPDSSRERRRSGFRGSLLGILLLAGCGSAARGPSLPSSVPPAPTGLTALGGVQSIALSWNPAAGAVAYGVYRSSTSGGAYAAIASVTEGAGYTDTLLEDATTYYYVVRAVNEAGLGPASAEVSGTTAPPAPTGVTAVSYGGTVLVSWSPSPGAASYVLLRGGLPGGPYSTVVTTSMTSYLDSNLTPGTTFYYVVEAIGPDGSARSLPSTAAAGTAVPPAVTDLAAASNPGLIYLSWSPVQGADTYRVLRASVTGGPYSLVGTATDTTYLDPNLLPGATYFYVVEGVNVGGVGPLSNEASATVLVPPPNPLTAQGGAGFVLLTWGPSEGAVGYEVYRGTTLPGGGIGGGGGGGGPSGPGGGGGGAGSQGIATTTATSYVDETVAPATLYYYFVRAQSPGGALSPPSQIVSAFTAPAPPTGVVASGGFEEIALQWNASAGATGYVVWRGYAPGGPYAPVGVTTATAFTDAGLLDGLTYHYAVAATNDSGQSGRSADAAATTIPGSPSGLTASGGTGQVVLSWYLTFGATAYVVLRSSPPGGPYAPVATSATNGYTDSGLADGTAYGYEVEAANVSGVGNPSPPASAQTLPAPPFGVTATAGTGLLVVSWSASAGATGYAVGVSTSAGGPFARAGTTPTLSFTVTGLRGGVTYYAVVEAADASGASAPSSSTSAVPATREVCVVNLGGTSIEAFDAGQSGEGPPLRRFGDLTGLRSPAGVTVDVVHGEVLVADFNLDAVRAYPLGTTLNVPALRVLQGSSTGLAGPSGIALDPGGDRIVVTNQRGDSITIFSRTASGDVPPSAVLQGGATFITSPAGIDVDSVNGRIVLADGATLAPAILVFPLAASGNASPVTTITGGLTGLRSPSGIVADPQDGEILVADAVANAVFAFPATPSLSNVAPSRTIQGPTTGLAWPSGLALDPAGQEIWVGNYASSSITVYPRLASGDAPPTRVLSGGSTHLSSTTGLALDGAVGSIWAASLGNGSVWSFPLAASGNVSPVGGVSPLGTGLSGPLALAVDLTLGEITAANGASGTLTVYGRASTGDVIPARTLTLAGAPAGVAIDPVDDRIFVANPSGGSIDVYAPRTASGSVPPSWSLAGNQTGLVAPSAVTVDLWNGEIWVADRGASALLAYPTSASGNVPPSRSIQGSAVTAPVAIAVDPADGEILVAEGSPSNAIAVYSRTASGASVAPLRLLQGGATQLTAPSGLVVDPVQGEILVSNEGSNAVTVYPRAASGNVPPARVLSGPSTLLDRPSGIAPCN